jgi:hypothetical protein
VAGCRVARVKVGEGSWEIWLRKRERQGAGLCVLAMVRVVILVSDL